MLFTVTLPVVMRGVALLDASTTTAALGADAEPGSTVAGSGAASAASTAPANSAHTARVA